MNLLSNIIPRIAWLISGKSSIWFFPTLISCWYFVVSRKVQGVSSPYPIVLRYRGTTLRLYMLRINDVFTVGEVYKELFVAHEYNWEPFEGVKTILDLGAHFGDTTLYYQQLFPDARIIAVEPLPENITRIKAAVADVPMVSVIEAAIGSVNSQTEFHVTRTTLGSSLLKRDKTVESITVTKKTLDTILEEVGLSAPVDLIKFDIEGGEFELFENIDPKNYARAYIGEVHLDYVEGRTLEQFLAFFKAFECTTMPSYGPEGQRFVLRAVRE